MGNIAHQNRWPCRPDRRGGIAHTSLASCGVVAEQDAAGSGRAGHFHRLGGDASGVRGSGCPTPDARRPLRRPLPTPGAGPACPTLSVHVRAGHRRHAGPHPALGAGARRRRRGGQAGWISAPCSRASDATSSRATSPSATRRRRWPCPRARSRPTRPSTSRRRSSPPRRRWATRPAPPPATTRSTRAPTGSSGRWTPWTPRV